MRTRSGKVYYPNKPNTDMDPNAFLSGISSTYYFTPKILKILEEIKTQMNTLDQRMDVIEVERRGRDCNEDGQTNQRREDIVK